jgi:hypothetical protein
MNINELFDSLTLPDIERFITTGREEDLVLEFKTINRPDLSHGDDKKNFAKALSGFANSSGGLIVWGIDGRKNDVGINLAVGKKEIHPLSLFVTRLNEFTGPAVSPIVEGVQHKGIQSVDDNGFAISLIPESDSGPHMAKFGEDRYYKRAGDSFYRMEHFDIEDMFGRRQKPQLRLLVKMVSGSMETSGGRHILDVLAIVSIENYGRGTAKAPFLAMSITSKHQFARYGIDGNGNFGLPRLASSRSGETVFGGNSDIVIHPGIVHEVTAILAKIHSDQSVADDIVFTYRVAAEGFRMVAGEMTVSGPELIKFAS